MRTNCSFSRTFEYYVIFGTFPTQISPFTYKQVMLLCSQNNSRLMKVVSSLIHVMDENKRLSLINVNEYDDRSH